MNKVIFERWKVINISLFIVMLTVFCIMNLTYDKWFQNADIDYIYRVFDGVYHPVMVIVKWLAGILGAMLFVPARIFKKWLLYAASPILLLTLYLVQGISVHSGNLLNPTRAQMAENGMIVLAVATIIFVLGYWWRDRKKKPAEV